MGRIGKYWKKEKVLESIGKYWKKEKVKKQQKYWHIRLYLESSTTHCYEVLAMNLMSQSRLT